MSVPFAPERPAANLGKNFPESTSYRLKKLLLGRPLVSEQLSHERLSKPVAFGVLAPDMISSSAYGTEEMLVIMVPLIGIGAFSMVLPVTLAIIAVLGFVLLSYLQVIGTYTKAGGSYVVARDNFGPKFAQVAAVALLIDYIVTVAVQTSAGTAALTSLLPQLIPYTVVITVVVTVLMMYGNLRGIREAGRFFAFPTYFFVLSLGIVVITGLIKGLTGHLQAAALPSATVLGYNPGHPEQGLFFGLSIFFLLKAFANGGASLTGLEAVSNGISSFRKPEARNGRITLTIMCCILGFLVLGTSLLAGWTHAVPYAAGTPTVVSQEVRSVLGNDPAGVVMFGMVQLATVLILFTGGNTSFNGFPYLASFVAGDAFLPRQMTKRGHRLAYSNGIIILGIVAIALIIVFQAQLNALIGLYAIGVFTGFCIAGSGMVKHHLGRRENRWRLGVMVNGFSAVLSGSIVVILLITKFTEGAWLIAAVAPPMYFFLLRLHRQYEIEADQLETGASQAVEAPILGRHVAIVLAQGLDMGLIQAIQSARSLRPDHLEVIHLQTGDKDDETLRLHWQASGIRVPLTVLSPKGRKPDEVILEYVQAATTGGDTECTVLIPRPSVQSRLQAMLHRNSADSLAARLSGIEHVSATIIPIRSRNHVADTPQKGRGNGLSSVAQIDHTLALRARGSVPIADLEWRKRATIAGRLRSVRVETAKGNSVLECELTDDSGNLLLVFMGRRKIPGVETGARLVAEGMVGSWNRKLAILNPDYELVLAD